jgi:hypothetical protein
MQKCVKEHLTRPPLNLTCSECGFSDTNPPHTKVWIEIKRYIRRAYEEGDWLIFYTGDDTHKALCPTCSERYLGEENEQM